MVRDVHCCVQVTFFSGVTAGNVGLKTVDSTYTQGRLFWGTDLPPSIQLHGGIVMCGSWDWGGRKFQDVCLELLRVCSDGVWIFCSLAHKVLSIKRIRVQMLEVL